MGKADSFSAEQMNQKDQARIDEGKDFSTISNTAAMDHKEEGWDQSPHVNGTSVSEGGPTNYPTYYVTTSYPTMPWPTFYPTTSPQSGVDLSNEPLGNKGPQSQSEEAWKPSLQHETEKPIKTKKEKEEQTEQNHDEHGMGKGNENDTVTENAGGNISTDPTLLPSIGKVKSENSTTIDTSSREEAGKPVKTKEDKSKTKDNKGAKSRGEIESETRSSIPTASPVNLSSPSIGRNPSTVARPLSSDRNDENPTVISRGKTEDPDSAADTEMAKQGEENSSDSEDRAHTWNSSKAPTLGMPTPSIAQNPSTVERPLSHVGNRESEANNSLPNMSPVRADIPSWIPDTEKPVNVRKQNTKKKVKKRKRNNPSAAPAGHASDTPSLSSASSVGRRPSTISRQRPGTSERVAPAARSFGEPDVSRPTKKNKKEPSIMAESSISIGRPLSRSSEDRPMSVETDSIGVQPFLRTSRHESFERNKRVGTIGVPRNTGAPTIDKSSVEAQREATEKTKKDKKADKKADEVSSSSASPSVTPVSSPSVMPISSPSITPISSPTTSTVMELGPSATIPTYFPTFYVSYYPTLPWPTFHPTKAPQSESDLEGTSPSDETGAPSLDVSTPSIGRNPSTLARPLSHGGNDAPTLNSSDNAGEPNPVQTNAPSRSPTPKLTAFPTTAQPTTSQPTTAQPTAAEPTTVQPTTANPTTNSPTRLIGSRPLSSERVPVPQSTDRTDASGASASAERPSAMSPRPSHDGSTPSIGRNPSSLPRPLSHGENDGLMADNSSNSEVAAPPVLSPTKDGKDEKKEKGSSKISLSLNISKSSSSSSAETKTSPITSVVEKKKGPSKISLSSISRSPPTTSPSSEPTPSPSRVPTSSPSSGPTVPQGSSSDSVESPSKVSISGEAYSASTPSSATSVPTMYESISVGIWPTSSKLDNGRGKDSTNVPDNGFGTDPIPSSSSAESTQSGNNSNKSKKGSSKISLSGISKREPSSSSGQQALDKKDSTGREHMASSREPRPSPTNLSSEWDKNSNKVTLSSSEESADTIPSTPSASSTQRVSSGSNLRTPNPMRPPVTAKEKSNERPTKVSMSSISNASPSTSSSQRVPATSREPLPSPTNTHSGWDESSNKLTFSGNFENSRPSSPSIERRPGTSSSRTSTPIQPPTKGNKKKNKVPSKVSASGTTSSSSNDASGKFNVNDRNYEHDRSTPSHQPSNAVPARVSDLQKDAPFPSMTIKTPAPMPSEPREPGVGRGGTKVGLSFPVATGRGTDDKESPESAPAPLDIGSKENDRPAQDKSSTNESSEEVEESSVSEETKNSKDKSKDEGSKNKSAKDKASKINLKFPTVSGEKEEAKEQVSTLSPTEAPMSVTGAPTYVTKYPTLVTETPTPDLEINETYKPTKKKKSKDEPSNETETLVRTEPKPPTASPVKTTMQPITSQPTYFVYPTYTPTLPWPTFSPTGVNESVLNKPSGPQLPSNNRSPQEPNQSEEIQVSMMPSTRPSNNLQQLTLLPTGIYPIEDGDQTTDEAGEKEGQDITINDDVSLKLFDKRRCPGFPFGVDPFSSKEDNVGAFFSYGIQTNGDVKEAVSYLQPLILDDVANGLLHCPSRKLMAGSTGSQYSQHSVSSVYYNDAPVSTITKCAPTVINATDCAIVKSVVYFTVDAGHEEDTRIDAQTMINHRLDNGVYLSKTILYTHYLGPDVSFLTGSPNQGESAMSDGSSDSSNPISYYFAISVVALASFALILFSFLLLRARKARKSMGRKEAREAIMDEFESETISGSQYNVETSFSAPGFNDRSSLLEHQRFGKTRRT